ncbi:MAG: sigma-70 family RNA polymerase sigma factor [Planctomycetes bacterium]|nr:sigma-70 family RNA polymerase sigma factor [Planctomycetota bacterium]MBL7008033.1 sigma-70 family RNA polymerase sigma factor [Planctomycetota bacterium]
MLPQPSPQSPDPSRITHLLGPARSGDTEAREELYQRAQGLLRAIAERHFRKERPGHTLQPTLLVDQAYLSLTQESEVEIRDRQHFLALASRIIRHILIDHARRKKRTKRGGGEKPASLQPQDGAGNEVNFELLDLNEALQELGNISPRQAQVVELKYFGGLKMTDVARVVGVEKRTVEGDWTTAKLWLLRRLTASMG